MLRKKTGPLSEGSGEAHSHCSGATSYDRMDPDDSFGGTHHHAGGGHSSTFQWSTRATLLFDGLDVGPDFLSFGLALIAIVAAGVARHELLRTAEDESRDLNTRTAMFFAQATIAYALMLLSMTFNIAVFFAVIVGLTAGWRRTAAMPIGVGSNKLLATNKGECCS